MPAHRLRAALAALCILLGVGSLRAQSIRGTVVDDTTKVPIPGVLITLIDGAGVERPNGVRTDSLGAFIIHTGRAGTWRVKALRIGYSPVTSAPVALEIGTLAVLRLRMTTVARQLVPVQVVEQRKLNAAELMSFMGFDLRRTRGLGKFLGGERLSDFGKQALREILQTQFQPTLYVKNDSVIGEILRMRQGIGECSPEIFLDGRLLAMGPQPAAIADGPAPTTAIDSVRAQTRAESDAIRLSADQSYALGVLSTYTADAIYGVEVYRANEVPPVSLGAWFGMTRSWDRGCGTVAVWTKAGTQSLISARSVASSGAAIQVITGSLIDFDTGKPLVGRPVALLSENRDQVGGLVITDDNGQFSIRTGRAGDLRLRAGGEGYLVSTTPAFRLSANELMVVRVSVSSHTGVLAPLGISARLLPQSIGVTSLSGFTYRRERAQGGTFFRASDITRTGARSIADLASQVSGYTVSSDSTGNEVTMTKAGTAPCKPVTFLDGVLLPGNVGQAITAVRMDRIFGVEIYPTSADIPPVFGDAGSCGAIIVWTKR